MSERVGNDRVGRPMAGTAITFDIFSARELHDAAQGMTTCPADADLCGAFIVQFS